MFQVPTRSPFTSLSQHRRHQHALLRRQHLHRRQLLRGQHELPDALLRGRRHQLQQHRRRLRRHRLLRQLRRRRADLLQGTGTSLYDRFCTGSGTVCVQANTGTFTCTPCGKTGQRCCQNSYSEQPARVPVGPEVQLRQHRRVQQVRDLKSMAPAGS